MKNINKKLFDIQCENLVFKKEADNPYFKSKYLALDDLLTGLKPVLEKYKVLITHSTHEKYVVTSVIDIESDEFVSSAFPIQEGIDPQKVGSAITYGKRYNLGQIFNIITDEDDDGNKASAKTTVSPYEQAIKKIKEEKDPKVLADWEKKINKSSLYDDGEKFELISMINEK